jgi:hypothetical protein
VPGSTCMPRVNYIEYLVEGFKCIGLIVDLKLALVVEKKSKLQPYSGIVNFDYLASKVSVFIKNLGVKVPQRFNERLDLVRPKSVIRLINQVIL